MYEDIEYVQPEHHLSAKYWYHVRMNTSIHFHCDVPRTMFSYLIPGAFVVVEKMIKNVGSKAENKKIVIKASAVTKFPVPAKKPSRGPCHTLSHLLPALGGNGIKLYGGW